MVVDVDRLASDLRVGIGLLVRRLRQLTVDPDGALALPQTAALARLDRLGPMTAAALARHEQISPQSMGATLSALQQRGLIAGTQDPADGRRVILSPTAAGLEVLRGRRSARDRRLAEALRADFTDDELRRLAAAAPLLERLAQRL